MKPGVKDFQVERFDNNASKNESPFLGGKKAIGKVSVYAKAHLGRS